MHSTYFLNNNSIAIMKDDLIKDVKEKLIDKLEGEIMMQILIDSNRQPCCISILNKSNVSSSRLRLVKNINSMTGWEQPTNAGKKVCVIIELIFEPNKITIRRLGVSGARKFNELSSYELSRE